MAVLKYHSDTQRAIVFIYYGGGTGRDLEEGGLSVALGMDGWEAVSHFFSVSSRRLTTCALGVLHAVLCGHSVIY